jgi:hypothetical protein
MSKLHEYPFFGVVTVLLQKLGMSIGGRGWWASMARYVTLGDLVSVILAAGSMWTGLVSRGFLQVSWVWFSVWYGFMWLVLLYPSAMVIWCVLSRCWFSVCSYVVVRVLFEQWCGLSCILAFFDVITKVHSLIILYTSWIQFFFWIFCIYTWNWHDCGVHTLDVLLIISVRHTSVILNNSKFFAECNLWL